ncbi:M23 family metallopeptidase [Sphingomonas sp. HF-S3]|uniref:M23 family metallopeptidase n=1 Tax=Sphingomonas rustica TaxID=3103142 RepID=A0ABV0B8D5_9SPHN
MKASTIITAIGAGGLVIMAASMIRIVPAEPPPAQPTPHVSATAVTASAPAARSTAQPGAVASLTVPVAGVQRSQITDNWGDPRGDGTRAHEGCDIMAAAGTPVLAAADGQVEKLFFSEGGGGISLYVRSPDRLWSYYYAHLQGYTPGLQEGKWVRAGEAIGYVGDTGNAGAGNFHLHFGVARMTPEQRWSQGEPINPCPMLMLAPGGAGS